MSAEEVPFLPAIGGLALLLAAGLGVTEFLPFLRRRSLPVRVAYGYLFGVAIVGGALFAGSHSFSLPIRRASVLGVALFPAVAGLARRLTRRHRDGADGGRVVGTDAASARDPFVVAGVLLGAVVSLGLLADAVVNPVSDADGRMTWCLHARYIRFAGTVDAPALRDARVSLTNRKYPLLLPLAQVAIEEAVGAGDDERVFRPLYAAFFPAFLVILYDGSRRVAGRRAAALTTIAVAATPFFAFFKNGGASGTYSDLPLACFFGAGVLLLLERPPSLSADLGAGLMLAAGALTKREGFVLAIVALGVGVMSSLRLRARKGSRKRRVPALLAAHLLPALCVLGSAMLFLSWSRGMPENAESYVPLLGRLSTYTSLAAGWWSAAPAILAQTLDAKKWGFLWVLVALLAVAGRRALRRPFLLPFLVAAAAPLALALMAYGIRPWFAKSTWNRFLIQASLPVFVVFAVLLRETLRSATRAAPVVRVERAPGELASD